MSHVSAIDFESTYTKTRSITTLGVKGYLEHPETEVYLVSIARDDGQEWVGNPKDAPWEDIWNDTWVSHNRTFDMACMDWGEHYGDRLSRWHCTADLAVFFGYPRSLAGATKELFGHVMSKETRKKMEGKSVEELMSAMGDEVDDYALEDARWCLKIWQHLGAHWSENERRVSQHTTLMSHRGIELSPTIDERIQFLQTNLFNAQSHIPWNGEIKNKKPVPILSPKRLNQECATLGIPAPTSTAKDSPAFEQWLDTYKETVPWVPKLGEIRSINRTLKVAETMRGFRYKNRLRYSMKYFGAHTGRWSSSGGINMHNFPQSEKGGVDLRSLMVPKKGNVFILCDFAQIEARILMFLAGDFKQLQEVELGESPYVLLAKKYLGWPENEPLPKDHVTYKVAKAGFLGLGYKCGATTLRAMVKSWSKIDLSPAEAKRIVSTYRKRNKKQVQLWSKLDGAIRKASREPDKYLEIGLPSGRSLQYFNVTPSRGYKAQVMRGGPLKFIHGGLLTENLVQAVARDVLANAVLEIEDAGLPVVLHVHDEVACEVPESDAEQAVRTVSELMSKPPEWLRGCPMEGEAEISTHYKK